MRARVVHLTLLAAACVRADADRSIDTDSRIPEDPDRPLPDTADTDLPTAPHTDPPAPDLTETGWVDTFRPADSSDTGSPVVIVWTTIPNLRAGIHRPGDILRIRDLVVTAVRRQRRPPASNGFVVQDPTVSRNGGLYVNVRDQTLLPSIGDVVTISGVYEEIGVGTPPLGTMARVTIHPSLADTWFTVHGPGSVPDPLDLDVETLLDKTGERYESMLVRIRGADDGELTVTGVPSHTWSDFPVSADGGLTEIDVIPWFYDLREDFSPTPGDTLTSLTGVLMWQGMDYNIAPRRPEDAEGIVDR